MNRLFAVLLVVLLSSCATTPTIDRSYNAAGQSSRAEFLILHYTVLDFPTSLKVLTEQIVSSHYLVRDNPPTIYQLVDETRQAHHAGVASWRGQNQINAVSIGIEIVNQGYVDSPAGRIWFDYPSAQIDAVIALVKKIVAEHRIRPERVLGHSDVAPGRKQDPGPRFPWKRFADEGLILWPDANLVAQKMPVYAQQVPDIDWFQQMLAKIGYAVPLNGQLDEATVNVIVSFQMKYRPSLFDGMPDGETAALLDVLTAASTNTKAAAKPPDTPVN